MSLTLPDTGIPALAPLLDGSLWQRWVNDGRVFPLDEIRPAIGYVRLKPGVSCRLTVFGADVGRADEPPPGFLLELFTEAARARQAFEKELTKRHVDGAEGCEAFLCEDPPVLAIPFPNDPAIPDLRHVYEPDRFRRSLSQVLAEYPESEWRIQRQLVKSTLLAYKPGRRAVFRLKVKLRRRVGDEKVRLYLHTKMESPRTVDRSYGNLRLLYEALPADASWGIPAPRGLVPERSFVATEWIDGVPLPKLLEETGSDTLNALRRTGQALAELHAVDVPLEHRPSPVEEAERVLALGADLTRLLPDEEGAITRLAGDLASRLSALATSPSSITHGDFHPAQVIIRDETPVLVDLDQAGRGYAVVDIGNFLAYLEELELPDEAAAAFLDGYHGSGASPRPDAELLRVTTALALFRRSVFPFRELRDDWSLAIRKRLELTRRELEGCAP